MTHRGYEMFGKETVGIFDMREMDITGLTHAADKYAKETAIEFAEFIKDNSYTKSDKGWYKFYTQRTDFPSGFSMSIPVYEFLTIDELFQLFLDHKSKEK